MTDNPMQQIRKLRDALNNIAIELGLELQNAAFIPAPPGTELPDLLQVAIVIPPEVFTTPEDKSIDEAFEQIIAGEKAAENDADLEARREAARKDTEDWLQ